MRTKVQGIVVIVVAASILLWAASLAAVSYRWKDKDGKTHYGSAVPAEYADLPYDILNNAGMVIEHVEVTREPEVEEVIVEDEVTDRGPMISDKIRQRHLDNLLIVQYRSEEEIEKELEFELTQLGYDSKLVHKSYENSISSIRNNIRQAGDQQRAGMHISEDQQNQIRQLYIRLHREKNLLSTLDKKEAKIRARLTADLKRYRELKSKNEDQTDKTQQSDQSDQG